MTTVNLGYHTRWVKVIPGGGLFCATDSYGCDADCFRVSGIFFNSQIIQSDVIKLHQIENEYLNTLLKRS